MSNNYKWNPQFWTPIFLMVLCGIVAITAILDNDPHLRIVGVYLGISTMLNLGLLVPRSKYVTDLAKERLYYAISEFKNKPTNHKKWFGGAEEDKDINEAIDNLILTIRKLN